MRWWMTWWEKAIATIYFAFERVMNSPDRRKKPGEPPASTDPRDNKHEGEGN